ncbi:MAG: DUF441 domain-containing protein [Clostridia bacterium]|nr:DUF441 domain-containing protein [Clostridia bacterium]
MSEGTIVLVGVLLLGLMARNAIVAGSACILLLLKLGQADAAFAWLMRYGLTVGYVFLILAVLVPVAMDQLDWRHFFRDLVSVSGLTAVIVSAAGSWVGRFGVRYMDANPQILVALVVGTIVGTALMSGVPTGPIIAAGVTALVLRLFQ